MGQNISEEQNNGNEPANASHPTQYYTVQHAAEHQAAPMIRLMAPSVIALRKNPNLPIAKKKPVPIRQMQNNRRRHHKKPNVHR